MTLRVLVIDDDPASLELMRYLVANAGCVVDTATRGSDGLDRARAAAYDVILCDIQLPGLDGREIARCLRTEQLHRRTTLIAVTASAMPSEREAVMQAGFDACLLKPIDPEGFVAEVMRQCAVRARGTSA